MKPNITEDFANRDLLIPSSQLQGAWVKPGKIEIDGDDLIWRQDNSRWLTATENRMRTMLARFIRLEDADKQEILKFAQRYGVLGICRHQWPASHNQLLTHLPLWLEARCQCCNDLLPLFCTPQQRQDEWTNTVQRNYFEPIERWHYFSRKARATLNLAKALGSEEPQIGDPKDWDVVSDWLVSGAVPKLDHIKTVEPKYVDRLRLTFSSVINAWLEVTGVRVMFGWSADSTFKLSGPLPNVCVTAGILPPLAVYIMLLVNRSRGLAICSNPRCGAVFSLGVKQPRRSAKRGPYCPECRKGKVGRREASLTYQQRERENPDRKRRKRLTAQQRKEIKKSWQECKVKERRADFVKRLAIEYGTSGTNVYRIIKPV